MITYDPSERILSITKGNEIFAVTRLEGKNEYILGKYDNLQEARQAGDRIYNSSKERMLLSLIEAEFDETDHMIGNRYRLYHVWGAL